MLYARILHAWLCSLEGIPKLAKSSAKICNEKPPLNPKGTRTEAAGSNRRFDLFEVGNHVIYLTGDTIHDFLYGPFSQYRLRNFIAVNDI